MRHANPLLQPWVLAIRGMAVSLQMTAAHAITTWNWSFVGASFSQSASGTFTTADVMPTPGVTYPIIGITGAYNRDGVAYNITGLSSAYGSDNQFQVGGLPSSPILLTASGISFSVDAPANVNLYCAQADPISNPFCASSNLASNFTGGGVLISPPMLNQFQGHSLSLGLQLLSPSAAGCGLALSNPSDADSGMF
jgi:hypothetical protein